MAKLPLILILILVLGSGAVCAQQPEDTRAPFRPSVIDRIEAGDPHATRARRDYFTATYSVPAEEIPDYRYDIMSVFRHGAGGGRVENSTPDELGVIHARVMRQHADEQYQFLVATHRESGEQYYVMDLPPLRISPVLGAIGLARGKARGTRMVMPVFKPDRDRDILVRISGKRLSAQDVYDMIREQTGCTVADKGTFLEISGCLANNDREAMP